MSEPINGNLAIRAAARADQMDWTASPSGTVWRKRFHLVGPPEAGQVTSLVRYEPQSDFPIHDHPDGEEILVLEGVFSDEHGDWPKGTYLLNPEGFRHAPFSGPGCLLWVKLRQFPGRDREHLVIGTDAMAWVPTDSPRVARKALYQQAGYTDRVVLERWEPGTVRASVRYDQGVEIFVVDGQFADEQGSYPRGSWLRLPPGESHQPRSDGGCTLYLKLAGFPYLKSSTSSQGGRA